MKIKVIKVTLDRKRLERDIFSKGEKIIIKSLTPIVEQRIRDNQSQMVEEFEDHPVSQEIWAGNTSDNSSGLLGGYGNLFSFIGFDEGTNPISPLSFILRRKITHQLRRKDDRGNYILTVNTPSKEDMESNAKVGWMGGRSWLDGIEKGIAGLNKYLYDGGGFGEESYSKTGIQLKHNARTGVNYKNTKYVSKILNDFKKRLSRF